jgi:hypothetical protein
MKVKISGVGRTVLLSDIFLSRSKATTDVILVCDDGEAEAHREVLGRLSQPMSYLMHLTIQNYEQLTTSVLLPGVSIQDVNLVLTLAYMGECRVTTARRENLLILAGMLGIETSGLDNVNKVMKCDKCARVFSHRQRMRNHRLKCPSSSPPIDEEKTTSGR